MKHKSGIRVFFFGALFCLLPLGACNEASTESTYRLSPKAILTGVKQPTVEGNFDYYLLSDNTYAIALKEVLRTTNLGTITIPDDFNGVNITGIWTGAFRGNPTKTIKLGKNIKVIDYEAFMDCDVENITFPYALEEMGEGAFYSCTSLKSARFTNVEGGSSTGGEDALVCDCEETSSSSAVSSSSASSSPTPTKRYFTEIPAFCFFNCNKMTELVLPSKLKNIQYEAFNGCVNLKSKLYFENIEIIRSRAFQGCVKLTQVYISKSLFATASNVGIEPHAFNYCNTSANGLDVHFCATDAKIKAWLDYSATHAMWGWYDDRGDPNTNRFYFTRENGETHRNAQWTYLVTTDGTATITHYDGDEPSASAPNRIIVFPEYISSYYITRIDTKVFDDSLKPKIDRIYLPPRLEAIENEMFDSNYSNLVVVSDRESCVIDEGKVLANQPVDKRIDLSALTYLKYIGYRAFAQMGKHNDVRLVHLPSNLIAVGDEAFCMFASNMHMGGVKEFRWDYTENSRLETIGNSAFFKMGCSNASTELGSYTFDPQHQKTTLIFPKTFRHFGILDSDKERYEADGFSFESTPVTNSNPIVGRAFAGCPLLYKVAFRGGTDSYDLTIPSHTFTFTHALQTIVFEERNGKTITFDTANGYKLDPSIGSTSGRVQNDFRGDPGLQTIVLPNQNTTLRFQHYALQANSRAALYLSGKNNSNIVGDTAVSAWYDETASREDQAIDITGKLVASPNTKVIDSLSSIADEEFHGPDLVNSQRNRYTGFCYTNSPETQQTEGYQNRFNITQNMPVYEDVYYEEWFDDVQIKVGTYNENSSKFLMFSGQYAFICEGTGNQKKATLSKFLFNLRDDDTTQDVTATIPSSVTVTYYDKNASGELVKRVDRSGFTVVKVGESAFSAAFCDGNDTSPKGTTTLTTVLLPDSVNEIASFAFIRAYGVTNVGSYNNNTTSNWTMPSSLLKFGRNAFTFCGVEKVLKIPYTCTFYENRFNTENYSSCFSNCFHLRQVTFLDGSGNESYSSKYYKVTTYTQDTNTFASAIYAEATATDGNYKHNKDRLLLVLYRDYGAIDKPTTDSEWDSSGNFNGQRKSNPFLYGAFKMGFWIDKLNLGNPTLSGSSPLPQALFSGICLRSVKTENGVTSYTFSDKYLYLSYAIGDKHTYDEQSCDITEVSGDIFNMQAYVLDGCENLSVYWLPERTASNPKALPDGVFREVDNANMKYKTYGSSYNDVAGVLDLSPDGYKGYSGIGKETFYKNASLTKFIAPNVSTFTIDQYAFAECTNLKTLDFSRVTGTLTLNANCFYKCSALSDTPQAGSNPIPAITWPTGANVKISFAAFAKCSSLTSLTLPATLSFLGENQASGSGDTSKEGCFQDCTKLTSVTFSGTNSSLQAIGSNCFKNCEKLDEFDFASLTNVWQINNYAFYNTGKLSLTGDVVLPANISTIREFAFSKSRIITMDLKRDSKNAGGQSNRSLSIKPSAFESCGQLTKVLFHKNAPFDNWSNKSFKSCTNLVTLRLPSAFDNPKLSDTSPSEFISGDVSVNLYVYRTVGQQQYLSKKAWRIYSGTLMKNPIFYVEQVSDTKKNGEIGATDEFWTEINGGDPVYLGTAVDNGGTITFSPSGYTLDANGFHAPS